MTAAVAMLVLCMVVFRGVGVHMASQMDVRSIFVIGRFWRYIQRMTVGNSCSTEQQLRDDSDDNQQTCHKRPSANIYSAQSQTPQDDASI